MGVMMDEEEALGSILPMAYFLAHDFEGRYKQDEGEFETAALIGAWKAVKNYRPDKGASLRTYARYRIVGEIIDWHREECAQKGGSRQEHLRTRMYRCVDFNDLSRAEDGTMSEAMIIESMFGSRTVERGYAEIENHDLLLCLRDRMQAREWDIMIRCVCNEEPMKSVGDSYGVTESRICQILPVALRHAKKIINDIYDQDDRDIEIIRHVKDSEEIKEDEWLRSLN